MPIKPELFRATLGRFATGVTVVTTIDAKKKPHGLTVSAFASVSLEPPLVLVCIDRANGVGPTLAKTGRFIVNVLEETQEELSRRFSETPAAADPFEGVDVRIGLGGIPMLRNSLAALECRITEQREAGDHTIFLAEVEFAHLSDAHPLLYFRGAYRRIER
jgi:flavin reductase (DIM6/NTAB) family NADH-FMN oxidoreductase RutF